MKKVRIDCLKPTFTWVYPSVEACYFATFEGTDPNTIEGARRIDLDPGDYAEAEWMGFELDRSHDEDRFFNFTRMVIVRWVKGIGWRKSLEAGWTSPRLIPFNRNCLNAVVNVTRIDDSDESQFDLEQLFEEAEKMSRR